jgi:hypothetical protein
LLERIEAAVGRPGPAFVGTPSNQATAALIIETKSEAGDFPTYRVATGLFSNLATNIGYMKV